MQIEKYQVQTSLENALIPKIIALFRRFLSKVRRATWLPESETKAIAINATHNKTYLTFYSGKLQSTVQSMTKYNLTL